MELRKHGVTIRLQEQPLRVLATLLERPGAIVNREELQERIWGKDTFVDFEQSLNKAVNRLREALNDEAGQPRYVETVPRRGYRFIAPVTGPIFTEKPRPPMSPGSITTAEPAFAPNSVAEAPPATVLAKKRRWLALGVSAGVVLLAAIFAFVLTRSAPPKTVGRSLIRLTANGTSFDPAISRDGKMIAYAAAVGGFNKDIWVQQVAGGHAIKITHEKEGALAPAFSPDGSQIAYVSHGGIYEIPALGGDARLIVNDGFSPAYTPDGSTVLFVTYFQAYAARLYKVLRMGGTPVAVRPDLPVISYLPSPDGKRILVRVAREGRESLDLMRWWTISTPGGELAEIDPPAAPPGQTDAGIPLDWVSLGPSGQQWILFSRPQGGSTNLFRVPVTGDGNVLSDAEQITSAPAVDFGAAASSDGRMVFSIGTISSNLWSIPIDTNRGRVTGERQRLTQLEGVGDEAVSLSRDGKRAVFVSQGRILLKELETERETQLAVGDGPVISPDGSFVAYTVTEGQKSSLYMVPATGGASRRICQGCASLGPKGFSADGSRILAQDFSLDTLVDRIELINIASGEVKVVLSHSNRSLWHPYYSWDDKWMTFKMQLDPPVSGNYNAQHFRIYVTPVEDSIPAGEGRWIALTSGEYADDKPQLSPDGNTLYFTSNRDHHNCFWAQRLNPKTKRPEGAPFAIQHLHYQQAIGAGGGNPLFTMELNVARDKIVTNIEDAHSDIWMTQLAQIR